MRALVEATGFKVTRVERGERAVARRAQTAAGTELGDVVHRELPAAVGGRTVAALRLSRREMEFSFRHFELPRARIFHYLPMSGRSDW